MIGKRMKKTVVLGAMILGSLTVSASAATISVKQLGCGSTSNCYTTISAAITNALAGDTVTVFPGTYNEAVVLNKNLTLLGSGPQFVKIVSSGEGITVNPNVSAKIIGLTITASNNGINLRYGSSTIIENNCLVSNVQNGIYVDGSNSGSSYLTNATIINNVISFNAQAGISNNNYYQSNPNMSIANNIIFNNGTYGLYLPYGGTESISYNDIAGNLTANYFGCSVGTGDISSNPLFIDYTNGNFALQSSSPCKNAGRIGSADADPDGTRNDMGAFGGPDAAPFWPYPAGTPIITILTANPTSVQKGATITVNATGEIK
jgi:nitrous oxidase accessory protein NosD